MAKEAKNKHAASHKAALPVAEPAAAPKQKEIKITMPEIKGVNLTTLTMAAAVLLLILVSFQALQAYSITKKVNVMAEKAEEASKPAVIEVTAIEADCTECTPLAAIMAQIQSAKVEIAKSLSLQASD